MIPGPQKTQLPSRRPHRRPRSSLRKDTIALRARWLAQRRPELLSSSPTTRRTARSLVLCEVMFRCTMLFQTKISKKFVSVFENRQKELFLVMQFYVKTKMNYDALTNTLDEIGKMTTIRRRRRRWRRRLRSLRRWTCISLRFLGRTRPLGRVFAYRRRTKSDFPFLSL